MKILIVDDEPELRELMAFMVESSFRATVIQAASAKEAIEVIRSEEDLSCVVCDYSMAEGNGEEVFRFLLNEGRPIPFILCSAYHPEKYEIFTKNKIYGFVVKPLVYEPLRALLKGLVSEKALARGGYSPLKVSLALKYGVHASDLYLKVGEEKYLKVIHQGSSIDSSDVDRFRAKNIEYLYVSNAGAASVLQEITVGIEHLSRLKEVDLELSFRASDQALELINDLSRVMGFTPEVQKLTKESIGLTLKSIQGNEALKNLLLRPDLDENGYRSSHSVVLAYAACGIASLMGWISEGTFYKLSMAAFLHDITLPSDEIAKVQSMPEFSLRRSQFSEEEMAAFMRHTDAAAELLACLPEVPANVDVILRQHHEQPDGKGFPKCLTYAQLSPLSCVFIVAHRMLNLEVGTDTKDQLLQFLGQLGPEYEKGTFGKIVNSIRLAVV